ncbi:MAG: LysE family translocator [Pseudomonadaceae bacterium]|nr:LysE family translocator [Pseudomonadaceae bacterium]
MSIDQLAALAMFAFVSSITPGPNNLMLMASGANFGLRRSLPHMIGVTLGFMVMLLGVGLGLMALFERYPLALTTLQVVCTGYLLYLAWRIATASRPDSTSSSGKPLTFLQSAAFQWVNPKAWTMGVSAMSLYAPGQASADILTVVVVFGLINLPCISTWTLIGQRLASLLRSPTRLRWFNRIMAALLLTSLAPVIRGWLG